MTIANDCRSRRSVKVNFYQCLFIFSAFIRMNCHLLKFCAAVTSLYRTTDLHVSPSPPPRPNSETNLQKAGCLKLVATLLLSAVIFIHNFGVLHCTLALKASKARAFTRFGRKSAELLWCFCVYITENCCFVVIL